MSYWVELARPHGVGEGLRRDDVARQLVTSDTILEALDVLSAPKAPGGDPGAASTAQIAEQILVAKQIVGRTPHEREVVDVFTLMPQLVEEGEVTSAIQMGDKRGEGTVVYRRVLQSPAVEPAKRTPQPHARRQKKLQLV